MHGWHMTGVDVTEVAQQWAQRNLQANPQLAHLLEVRLVEQQQEGQEGQQDEVGAGAGRRGSMCWSWRAWRGSPCSWALVSARQLALTSATAAVLAAAAGRHHRPCAAARRGLCLHHVQPALLQQPG